jgi:hypothetical protein
MAATYKRLAYLIARWFFLAHWLIYRSLDRRHIGLMQHYPRRGIFITVMCGVARASLRQRRRNIICPRWTSRPRCCWDLGRGGGASGGPGRREGDGVGCIVIDMASGYGIPLWQAKIIAVMFYPRHPLRPQLRLHSLLLGSNSKCF